MYTEMGTYVLFLVFLKIFLTCNAQEDSIVDTAFGIVRGKSIILDDGSTVDAYMGIPYAKPPLGEARFEFSELVEPWTDIFDATEPKNHCLQQPDVTPFNSSEDCLHMNIYSPKTTDPDNLLPVMIYIHGGAYTTGMNNLYQGYFLARKGVVMVAINYRIGVLGFAYTGDGIIPGNMGLMDQVLALTFVQEIISAFGGDPTQVTIFGQSAGASSVAQLTMIPYAQGLFSSAILQSGCEFSTFATNLPEEEPEKFVVQVAEQFDCPTEDSTEMKVCLQSKDGQELVEANIMMPPGFVYKTTQFTPVIDGDVIPDTYDNLRAKGDYAKVPEMIGITENEYTIFSFFWPDRRMRREILLRGVNRTDMDEILWSQLNNKAAIWPNSTDLSDVFAAFSWFYTDWPYYEDIERNREMLFQLLTDETFGWPADKHAKYVAPNGLPVYYYIYDYILEQPLVPAWFGAYHSIDVFMVFGSPFLLMPENEMAYNHSRLKYTTTEFNEGDIIYSDFIMNLWTNFAKYGNPTPEGTVGPNGTSITWRNFTNDEQNYINLKLEPEAKQNYRQDAYAFWREYLPYLVYRDIGKTDRKTEHIFDVGSLRFQNEYI